MLGVQRTDGNLMLLYAVYLAALTVGNVMDESYAYIFGVTLPASVIFYPLTFLIANIIHELWGEHSAARGVLLGLAVKFIGIVLMGLSQLLVIVPDYGFRWEMWRIIGTSFWEVSEQMMLGRELRIWTVSIISFPIAQFANVLVFGAILKRHIRRTGGPWGGRWVRFLAAALAGELTETALFISLAFAPAWGRVGILIRQQLYVRSLLTAFTLPVFYALTWRRRNNARTV